MLIGIIHLEESACVGESRSIPDRSDSQKARHHHRKLGPLRRLTSSVSLSTAGSRSASTRHAPRDTNPGTLRLKEWPRLTIGCYPRCCLCRPTRSKGGTMKTFRDLIMSVVGLALLGMVGCGSAQAPSCTGTSCACPSGASCDLSQGGCSGGSCTATCSDKNNCIGSCGQSCSLACSNGTTCTVTVGPSASVNCTSGSTCHITCTGSCSVGCTGGSTCDLTCSGKAMQTIGQGGQCP